MAWTVSLTPTAAKQLRKLDRATACRIADYLKHTAQLPSPTQRGKALTGPYGGLWRYRVGDYRIICELNNGSLTILVLTIRHRSSAYK